MATTSYGVNHPMAVKTWSRVLSAEVIGESYVGRFMSKASDSLFQVKTEVSKGPGDKVTCGLRMLLTGSGVQGDDTQEGNEEPLSVYNDSVLINQLRHAVRSGGDIRHAA